MSVHPPTNSVTQANNHFYNLVAGRIPRGANALRSGCVDIIIPVYNALELTEACISTVLKNSAQCRLIVVNDASTDPAIKPYLNSLRSIPGKNIELIVCHNAVNLGFLKTVNDAYQLTKGHFVILNSDTEVPPGWLDRLFAPLFAAPETVASVTPFSNASMKWLGCNFPDNEQDNEIFKMLTVAQLDDFFSKYSLDTPIEIFSGCGFCMAFNRAVVDKIGLFDYETFGRGYGEEVDWSLRAVNAGYKHLLAPDLFVYHKHSGSFAPAEKQALVEANVSKLHNIHEAEMKRMAYANVKDATQPIRDALAIIADAQTKKSDERWIAVIGGDRSSWDLLKESLPAAKYRTETNGFVFITYSAEQGLITVHVLSPYQERSLCLPGDAGNYMDNLLILLNIDTVILLQKADWPDSIDLLMQVERLNKPYEIIEMGNTMSLSSGYLYSSNLTDAPPSQAEGEVSLCKESLVALYDVMASIAACTPLKSKAEMNAATFLIEKLGLPLHNDHQKNWDTLKALYYVARSTDSKSSILDAGGGLHSPVLNALASFGYDSIYACDVVDVNYTPDKFSDKIKFSVQNIEQTDYPAQFFHAVTCLSVIEHGVDHRRFFAEMSRITKEDGLLIITADYWPDFIDCSGIFPYGTDNPEMKVYQAEDINDLVQMGNEFGFELCAPLKLTASERAVRWDAVDREYTFIFIAMRKMVHR